eukprot:CAMPEP_0178922822 /NCGR_PEP_ID=MMETSP0786-20121207/16372_1 /TAXON_ID=186022 /ORGANISM="Thalassionema frauenfeldii, Strain CCMP 1798" /LENGTH=138 /DNA_ID=CAMNT_0020597239 /DNA_START=60 /DNA_END=476 /DNA_ORIENTATION=-
MTTTKFAVPQGLAARDTAAKILAAIDRVERKRGKSPNDPIFNEAHRLERRTRFCKEIANTFILQEGLTEQEASAQLLTAIGKEQRKHGMSCDGCYRSYRNKHTLKAHKRYCEELKELEIIRNHLRGELGLGEIQNCDL